MIYVTGDTHGCFGRFEDLIFYETPMTREDYVIVLGDFGGIWDNEKFTLLDKENAVLDALTRKPFTILFIDGNHENFDRLYEFTVEEWHGGKIHKIRENIFHLMRGEIFDIENKKFFVFGGAASHDIEDGIITMDNDGEWIEKVAELRKYGQNRFRIKGLSWWEQEMLSAEEKEDGLRNLSNCNNKVDFVLSHCGPQQAVSELSYGSFEPDALTTYLASIASSTKYEKWFFGHYHCNKWLSNKFVVLYDKITRIN